MKKLDGEIAADQITTSEEPQLVHFQGLCKRQQDFIDDCRKNKWIIPVLKNNDIDGILKLIEQQKNILQRKQYENEKKAKNRRKRRILYVSIAAIAIAIIGAVIGINSYNTKLNAVVTFSKDSDDFIGQNYSTVIETLKSDGFMNIQAIPYKGGWEAENTVLQVSLDNEKIFKKGEKLKANTKVFIKYSSKNLSGQS